MERWLNLSDELVIRKVKIIKACNLENGSAFDPGFCLVECGV